jgi:hypothetical protein
MSSRRGHIESKVRRGKDYPAIYLAAAIPQSDILLIEFDLPTTI